MFPFSCSKSKRLTSNIHSGYSSLPRSTMSEPMGCSNQMNSGFLQDSTVPLLETVSEEARRQTGKYRDSSALVFVVQFIVFVVVTGLENNGLSDYYFRDSFDHSSSESGFTSLTENRIGHRLINTSHNIPLSITNVSSNNSAAVINQQNATNNAKTAKRFSILHAFVPSFIFVVIALVVLTIFILESESEMVSPIRDLPEMKILKYQYYQPLKDIFAKFFINQ